MDKKSTTPITDEAELLSRDLHAFLSHALKPEIYQRKGQRFMNCLRIYRPDLANGAEDGAACGLFTDPFYADEALPGAIAWVRDNWER